MVYTWLDLFDWCVRCATQAVPGSEDSLGGQDLGHYID